MSRIDGVQAMPHPEILLPSESALLVIDVQEKLLPKIATADDVVREIAFILDVAKVVGVEVLGTEQYPKGLGPTTASLSAKLPSCGEKLTFSCAGVPGLVEGLRGRGKERVVLVGIESHVCVLHTAYDLLDAGFHVYLAIDAVASRSFVDHETAIRRLERAGVVLTTVETVAFEWLGGAQHPSFKAVSSLIQERMKLKA